MVIYANRYHNTDYCVKEIFPAENPGRGLFDGLGQNQPLGLAEAACAQESLHGEILR
jgi:hypothetical protein